MLKRLLFTTLAIVLFTPVFGDDIKTLQNNIIAVSIDLSDGVSICSIYDKSADKEWLVSKEPLFQFNITNTLIPGGYYPVEKGNSTDLAVTDFSEDEKEMAFVLSNEHIDISTAIVLTEDDAVVTITYNVLNKTSEPILVHLVSPVISCLNTEGRKMKASIPYEIGSVGIYGDGNKYGAAPSRKRMDLPGAFNAIELATIYDSEKGTGIFFADLNGTVGGAISPLQLRIDDKSVSGRWSAQIDNQQSTSSPTMAIGLTGKGDWHEALDYYLSHHNPLPNPSAGIPAWLLESGAIYSTRREGTGGSYQCLPGTTDLNTRISSFEELPNLLKEAKSFGTSNLLLIDYFEPAYIDDMALTGNRYLHGKIPYWNKGDYIIRTDLGGEDALKKGIKKVHKAGGRVIVYVEPFIVYSYSKLGRTKGLEWASRKTNGTLDDEYKDNYTMNVANTAWQDEVVRICMRLVKEFGVDGILLDSTGWQWNRLYYTVNEGVIYSQNEYNAGFIAISDKVRRAIREIKPDAVVMSESCPSGMIGHNDGGFSADYVWSQQTANKNITTSPLRYAFSGASIFSSGLTVNTINQVFACGFSLSLCDYWMEHAPYIKELVRIRQKYSDALVYGKLLNTPSPKLEEIGVNYYKGERNDIITIINTGKSTVDFTLDSGDGVITGKWKTIFGGDKAFDFDTQSNPSFSIKAESIVVLKKR